MTRKLIAGVALAIVLILLAAGAVHTNRAPSWADFVGRPGDVPQPNALRGSNYPLSMELPDAERLASNSAGGRSPAGTSAPSEPVEETGSQLTQPPAELARARGPATARQSLLPVDFDVADFGDSAAVDEGGKVRTSKSVILGGSRLGTIELAVGRGASVSVDRRVLTALVGDKAPELTAALSRVAGDRVTLDSLRNREVAIRYDPVADALVIDSGS
jgi:hypothetical protein